MDLKGPENYDRLLLIIENKYPKFVLNTVGFNLLNKMIKLFQVKVNICKCIVYDEL